MWTIFKVFIDFVTVFFLFWIFGPGHEGSQLPDQGSNPHPCLGR